MTTLVEALKALGLEGEIMLSGRWVRLQGELCFVYVAEMDWNERYCTWCDDPQARSVEFFSSAIVAIQVGLRRAEMSHGDGKKCD